MKINKTSISHNALPILTSLDNYEEEAEYSCPNCERVESDSYNELIEQIKESDHLNLDRDDYYLTWEEFEDHKMVEDISGTAAFHKKCERCQYEYQVDVEFNCPGNAEWMFQDKEHHKNWLAGDA